MGNFENRQDILVGKCEGPCIICGKPTKNVEIYSEGYFCSEECMNKFYDEWGKQFEAMCKAIDEF